MVSDPLKSIKETAEILTVSTGTIRKLAAEGHLPPVRISARVIRFHLDDIQRYLVKASGAPDD